jgi:hypothetical protein
MASAVQRAVFDSRRDCLIVSTIMPLQEERGEKEPCSIREFYAFSVHGPKIIINNFGAAIAHCQF